MVAHLAKIFNFCIFARKHCCMVTDTAAVPPVAPNSDSARTPWQRCLAFLVRYRVRISLIVFVGLIAEDLLKGVKPNNLMDVGNLKSMLGLSLVVGGLALRSWAAGTLHKTTELTTSGPYALIRHPLYVGSFLMMLGFCSLIGDRNNVWFILGPFGFIYMVNLLHEERRLPKKFGARWQQYVQAVPRFVPYRLPTDGFATWSGQQWFRNREYNAVAATTLGLIAVQAWAMLS